MRRQAASLPPYRVFFALAAVGGLLPVGAVVASASLPAVSGGWPIGRWHAHEMVLGYFAAAFAGVLLTALPRWTGCSPVPLRTVLGLAALWIAGRCGLYFAGDESSLLPQAARASSALFVAALTTAAGVRILRAGAQRDAIVPVILALLVAADLLLCVGAVPGDMGLRLVLACALGIATLMGGRVAPALTRHLANSRGRELEVRSPRALERLVAGTTALTLVAWCLWPSAFATGSLLVAAAAAHGARLIHWRGWTTVDRPSFLALHLGYAFLPGGFVLAACAMLFSDTRFVEAGLHAWGSGVLGVMCGAIQASVVRRHDGRALTIDRLSDAACAAFFTSALLRTMAPFLTTATQVTVAAAIAWCVGQTALAALLFVRQRTKGRM